MKRLIFISLILAFTTSLNAQTSDKVWGVGGAFGAYGTLNHGGIGVMPELYLSRYLSPKLDVMFKPELGIFNSTVKSTIDIATFYFNLRYKLTDESKNLRPYLFAGPGFLFDNNTSGLNFDLGFGLKNYKNSKFITYLEAGYLYGVDSKSLGRENIWKVTAGVEVDLGKVKDADMDGVSDKKDKCPNTPTGVAVDAVGCPIDTDGDGVADYLDDCPTVKGLTSLKGCPDADKDGIADKDDACPDVAGLVKLKGCPDTDGDGVADKDDKCPDTKKGYKVDASGCPFDTDKDGVIDEEDNCPTVAGPKDNKGCPAKEAVLDKTKELTSEQVIIQKIDIAPVHFVSGKSYLTDYSKGILAKLIKIMNSDKAYNVNIFGYTDSKGSEAQNLKLSQDRITSVSDYLKSKGISDNRIIQQKALGKAKPVASNDTPEGRLKNRRVEFEIFKMK
jgi:outer membrane protein OmpA-like peptidoglycan-associated protein